MIELIPPALRARLKTLRLRARLPAGQLGLGQHASRSRGAGLEFAQYRAYEPGDDPRRVDWKLYARSDRYYVRESERDSPLALWVLVDTSASMRQGDAVRPQFTRLDAAKTYAACLVELALRQDDRFGIAALGNGALAVTPLGAGPRQRARCVQALAALKAGGDVPDGAALRPLWEAVTQNALVVLLTDGFDDTLVAAAERYAAARREVICIQLLTAEERDFPFRGGQRFRDPESNVELPLDADAARADFLARFAAAQARLAARFAAAGIRHVVQYLDAPLETALQRLFGARAEAAA